jgi:hypothetical protein
MLKELKIVMALLYLLTTVLLVATLYARTDRSWLTIGHGTVVWLFSTVAPARWTMMLVRRLGERGITLDRALQITIIMPSVCAALAVAVALNLLPR